MDYEGYLKIEEEFGAGSKEASQAYLELIVTHLEPITAQASTDDWGYVTITLKDHIELSGEDFLGWLEFFQQAEICKFEIKGNQLRLWAY